MRIANPTNDQIVTMIECNRGNGQCTRIIYRGVCEVWIYTTNLICVDTATAFNGEISVEELIRLMEHNQAEEVS